MNKVEPIRTKAKLDKMRNILIGQNYRNYMIFQFSIHVGMRISDVLELKVKDIKNKESIYVIEKKTRHRRRNKRNRFTIPKLLEKSCWNILITNSLTMMIICFIQATGTVRIYQDDKYIT